MKCSTPIGILHIDVATLRQLEAKMSFKTHGVTNDKYKVRRDTREQRSELMNKLNLKLNYTNIFNFLIERKTFEIFYKQNRHPNIHLAIQEYLGESENVQEARELAYTYFANFSPLKTTV